MKQHRRSRDKPLLPMAQKMSHRQQKRPKTLPMAPTSTPSAAPAVAEALELAQRARAPAGAVTERQRDVEDIDAAEAPAERSAAAVPWGCRGMVKHLPQAGS